MQTLSDPWISQHRKKNVRTEPERATSSTLSSHSEAKVSTSNRFAVLNDEISALMERMDDAPSCSEDSFLPISRKWKWQWQFDRYNRFFTTYNYPNSIDYQKCLLLNSIRTMLTRHMPCIGFDDHRKIILLLDQNKYPYFTYRLPNEKILLWNCWRSLYHGLLNSWGTSYI